MRTLVSRILPSLLITWLALPSSARVSRVCLVSHKTEEGRSENYKMEVEFVTGKELNKATKTYDYGQYSNYALIWFGQGQVAITEISETIFGVGEEFDNEDIRKLFRMTSEITTTQINNEAKIEWEITAKENFRWIDPRING